MVFTSIREHAEHGDFFASTIRNNKFALRACEQLQKFGEHEQASTRLNFASKSSKGKILEQLKILMDHSPLLNQPWITEDWKRYSQEDFSRDWSNNMK